METHYICTGECGGVSDTPGVCQDPTCSKHNQELVECDKECQLEHHKTSAQEENK